MMSRKIKERIKKTSKEVKAVILKIGNAKGFRIMTIIIAAYMLVSIASIEIFQLEATMRWLGVNTEILENFNYTTLETAVRTSLLAPKTKTMPLWIGVPLGISIAGIILTGTYNAIYFLENLFKKINKA